MKVFLAALYVFTAVAAAPSTYKFQDEDGATFSDIVDESSKSIGEEAIELSLILRQVASELSNDEELRDESDEYFWNQLLEKSKEAVLKAGQHIKKTADGAIKEAKCKLYEFLVKTHVGSMKKALGMVTNTIQKKLAGGKGNILASVVSDIITVAERLSQQGKQLTQKAEAF